MTLKSNSGELYFETEDMDAFYKHLESFDILYVHKLHEHPWGQRVVRFYDPDGHIIEAAEKLVIAFGWNHLPAGVRLTGFCVGMLGDAIFLLSVLCMKDSWRAGIPDKDKTELVTTGIYRFSRNPAFLGFDLMYVGVLLLYGNLLTLGFSVFAIVMLHLQILQEERYLVNTFGAPYQEYCRHVFRYLGRK